MPVYHFILHAYGTWHPDHPSGWHQHDKGRQSPQPLLAAHRRKHQRLPTVQFSDNLQHHLIERTLEACALRHIRPHAVATNATHLHLVASWTSDLSASDFQTTLKRLLALRCAELEQSPGRQWFSEGGKPVPVTNRPHLDHLRHEYLPQQGGLLHREHDHIKKSHGPA